MVRFGDPLKGLWRHSSAMGNVLGKTGSVALLVVFAAAATQAPSLSTAARVVVLIATVITGFVLLGPHSGKAPASRSPPASAGKEVQEQRIDDALAHLPTPSDATQELLIENINSLHLLLYRWCHELDVPAFRFNALGRTVIVTDDPATMGAITTQRPTGWRRPLDQNEMTSGLRIDGIFNAEGDKWRVHRKVTARAFNMPSVRKLFPNVTEIVCRLDQRWRVRAANGGFEQDFKTEMAHVTMEVIFATAFGLRLPLLGEGDVDDAVLQANHRKARLFYLTFEAFWHRFLHWGNPTWLSDNPSPLDRQHNSNQDELHAFVDGVVRSAEGNGPDDLMPCMLSSMIEASRQEGSGSFSHEEIIGNTITFANAGHETTANALSWFAFEMAQPKNAKTFGRLRAEAREVLGGDLSKLTCEVAEKRLPLCDAAFREAMRMHPVAPMFAFEANSDTSLPGIEGVVPEGTQVWCVFTSNCSRDRCFSEPERFILDRWLPAESREIPVAVHDPSSILPFGGGPRICPGMRLAAVEAVAVIATIAMSFDLSLVCKPDDVKEVQNLTVAPDHLPIRVIVAPN